MAGRSMSVVDYLGQRARPSIGQLEQGLSSTAFNESSGIQEVVIPSNLFADGESGPYITSAVQNNSTIGETSQVPFDARQIAQDQREETQRILNHSASVSSRAPERSSTAGHDSWVDHHEVAGDRHVTARKSSTPSRIDPTAVRQNATPDQLPTLAEGQPFDAEKSSRHGDYFGNYQIGTRTHITRSRSRSVANDVGDAGRNPFNSFSTRGEGDTRMSKSSTLNQTPTREARHSNTITSRQGSVVQRSASVVLDAVQNVANAVRRSSLHDVYEKAKQRGVELQRKKWVMVLFEYIFYVILLAFVYFVLIGVPLWKGAVYWLYWVFGHKFAVPGTWAVTIGVAFLYAYAPLLVFFEKDPPMPPDLSNIDPNKTPGVHNTALMIPCYKSAKIIGPTLEAAIKIFPPSHIFVIANGNSPTPLDDTEEVCRPYKVNHVWSPVGSKIVAQFVGCYAAKGFKNVLLIDDDCALPPNFPIVSERMTKDVKVIGYTIKSVGPDSSKGTLCQQAQDLEYKISGIQRALAGMIGSATFPHGAISLWDLDFLIQTFHKHPGFSVSEDWFFGHVARQLGSRIQMCTSTFIETETPNAVFFSSGGARGGFGEMTIFKQRFMRWNFFFVNGLYYNMAYILGSWKLGFYEIGAKLFVFQEVYETLLYLFTPFVLPISIIVRPAFFGYLFAATFVLYFLNVIIFNELHLRLKKERVSSKTLYLYYMPYKMVLTLINVASCYWSLYKYARYFAKRHPKIIEDERAVDVVLRMEESHDPIANEGRRMTITAIGAQLHGSVLERTGSVTSERKMTITTFGPKLDLDPMSPIFEGGEKPEGLAATMGGQPVVFRSNLSFGGADEPTRPAPTLRRETSEGVSPLDHTYRRQSSTRRPAPSLRRETSEGVSPHGHTHRRQSSVTGPSPGAGHQTATLDFADLAAMRTRSSTRIPAVKLSRGTSHEAAEADAQSTGSLRRSGSDRRSASLHRSDSHGRQERTDFVSPGFEELMDRLATIEERLHRGNVETIAVQVGDEIGQHVAPPAVPEFTSSVTGDDESDYELDELELEKEEARKTKDSRSIV